MPAIVVTTPRLLHHSSEYDRPAVGGVYAAAVALAVLLTSACLAGHGATENSEVPFALRPLVAGAGLPGLTLACRGLLQP
jgi:hypothetical protein